MDQNHGDVVLLGEGLDEDVLCRAHGELDSCDLCLVVGTSSVVYPAAMFAPQVYIFMSLYLSLSQSVCLSLSQPVCLRLSGNL